MAKERPVTAGGKTAHNRGRHPAVPPARTAPVAATPGPRRPTTASPADPRPIPPPFLTHEEPAAPPSPQPPPDPAPSNPEPPNPEPSNPEPSEREPSNSGPSERGPSERGPSERGPSERGPSERGPSDSGPLDPAQSDPAPPDPDAAQTDAAQADAAPAEDLRPELPKRGVARVPAPRPVLPGLQLQPMVHVAEMPEAVAFYEMLGGELIHGDRGGEWVLMQVGTAQIGLVTRPPDPSRGESTVELNFSATMPLDRLEKLLRDRGVTIVRLARDPDLGTRLHVETPDGMPVKIHQVEPDLLV
ncbi:VOC family protein [Pseudosporangium ferrugineum]|uniref:VOC domain-containing protein n=1 Tax=Pseudosporangium ferrugineum TaxID=439699 RepID=A0A2T0SDD7_9ACTN|nr:VOC family protein [Pseudosporangium ferrugineum]PRY31422.1 hypothetical protein CLV70_103309 [Pseudosporangium ferrugineum]